jgi:diacylglycerol O-acyltransferase
VSDEPTPAGSAVPPTRRALVSAAVGDHVRQVARLPGLAVRTVGRGWRVARHRRTVAAGPPVPMRDTPRVSFNRTIGAERVFAARTLPLDEALAVRRAAGVSLNDVVLAVAAGALRRHLAAAGALPDAPLVAAVPVAVDGVATDRAEGNHLSTLFTTLATDRDDPLVRLAEIHRVTTEAKEQQRILGERTFASWVQYTPPAPYRWAVRQWSGHRVGDRLPPPINVVVSNVPGPREPLEVRGARLRELISVGPVVDGVGLNVTVWSYAGSLHVGLLADADLLPDLATLADAFAPALDELGAALGQRRGASVGTRRG